MCIKMLSNQSYRSIFFKMLFFITSRRQSPWKQKNHNSQLASVCVRMRSFDGLISRTPSPTFSKLQPPTAALTPAVERTKTCQPPLLVLNLGYLWYAKPLEHKLWYSEVWEAYTHLRFDSFKIFLVVFDVFQKVY